MKVARLFVGSLSAVLLSGGRGKKYFKVTAKALREMREAQNTLIRLWRGVTELRGGTP